MADYATHKLRLDAEDPTPEIVWYLTPEAHDNPAHRQDDNEIATVSLSFVGEEHNYRLRISVADGVVTNWATRHIGLEDMEERADVRVSAVTWPLCKARFAEQWNAYCEARRVLVATERAAEDILKADGITVLPDTPVATAATATLGGIAPNSATRGHWELAPDFEANTLAYAFNSRHPSFLPFATLGHAGQTVYWKHGADVYTGEHPTGITLDTGENTITATVISEDGMHSRVYTLTVTKTAR